MVSNKHPFDLSDDKAYQEWRSHKLALAPLPPLIEIEEAEQLTEEQQASLARHCASHNFALFRFTSAPADPEHALKKMAGYFGLQHIDANLCAEGSGLTEITVKDTQTDNHYIPYTNKPIGWHTDGYYNTMDHQIHGMLLYCQQPAMEGGVNQLMDHDIAYIRLRDQNPGWIRALMAEDAFTIPPNVERGVEIRSATVGPVFSVSADGSRLHMRYSARQRNVIWKDDPLTREAAAALTAILNSDDPFALEMKLAKGEGVLSNNILHTRSGFTDAPDPERKRIMYRARYYDPVIG